MRLKVKEFFKINNVLDVKANTKELFIIVFFFVRVWKLNYIIIV